MKPTTDLRIHAGLPDLAQAAAELFEQQANAAVSRRGWFTVALAGGSTPRPMYECLAGPPFQASVPWEVTRIFWGDERCVPPNHPESNYRMALEALLSNVSVPSANIHRMTGEEPPNTAADAYAHVLRDVMAPSRGPALSLPKSARRRLPGDDLPRFDLVLLGMGRDGHTASLFPYTWVLHERERLVAAHYVARLASYRLTLTLPVINNAAVIVFLVAGQDKAEILGRVLTGPSDPEALPAQLIQPTDGRLIWMVDEAAAGQLE